MEKQEIIKEIDRILSQIKYHSKLRINYGICCFAGNIFREYLSNQACKKGLIGDTNFFWWYSNFEQRTFTSSEWYAPRIKFLEDWKKELLES